MTGGRGPPICKPGYKPPKKGGNNGGKRRCSVRRTIRVIRRAFVRLYCANKKNNKNLKPIRFLRNYFARYSTRNGYLPRRALRTTLRRALPKGAIALRRRLRSLRFV